MLLVLVLKLSIVLSPMPPQNSSGLAGSWLTWVLPRPPVLLFTAIIVVLFTLLIMIFFISAPSTLRSTVTSFVIIFSRVLFTYYPSPLRTSLLMSSPSPIHWDAYAILFPNSRWLLRHHLVFEGECQYILQVYQALGPIYLYCTYLYCTHYFAYIKAVPCINLIAEHNIQSYFAHFQSLFSLSLLLLNNHNMR